MKLLLKGFHKYIKRTGSSKNYKYWYKDLKTGKLIEGEKTKQKVIREIPMLDRVTLEDIQLMKDNEVFRNRVIEKNQEQVKRVAWNIVNKLSKIEIDDAIQSANEGFINAIEKFKTGKGQKRFKNYISSYMAGYIWKTLGTKFDRSINVSINDTIAGEEKELSETLPDSESMGEYEEIERKQAIEMLRNELIRTVSPQAVRIFDLMVEGRTKAEIARITKTKPSNITQIVKEKIKPIAERYLQKSGNLKEFIDYINVFIEEI